METWLDIIPAVPLARGVPVVNTRSGARGVALHCGNGEWVCHDGSRADIWPAATLRVDLADPQGFGYALRFYMTHRPLWARAYGGAGFQARWLKGQTTEADRVSLAKDLQEVSR